MKNLLIALVAFLALLSEDLAAMDYRGISENHTYTIIADGPIVVDEATRLQNFLSSTQHEGFRYRILLNSPGGALFGGIELGWLLRKLEISTEILKYDATTDRLIPGQCYSACSLAFFGGKTRSIAKDATIGFHQFSGGLAKGSPQEAFDQAQSDAQIFATLVLKYLLDMGADAELFHRMNFARPEDLYIPDQTQYRELGITTPTTFSEFGFEPYKAGVISFAKLDAQVVGRSVINQVTIYCRRGRPYLLMSGPVGKGGLPSGFASRASEHIQGFQLSSVTESRTYSSADLDFRAGDTVRIELRLDSNAKSILLDESFFGTIMIPAVYGFIFRFKAETTELDRQKIGSSLTHCIS